ncbi:MAG: energy-coupling factor transporter ATPase, partial [Clostridia bacterium]|nr:energy-coupling factor transporter ATPase [Clostridia bacterium]
DPIGRKEVMNTILRLNKEEGITIILITHYMNEAIQADRVIVMKNGEIFMQGTPNDVFTKPDDLINVGLEVPQSIELIHRLNKEAGLDIPLMVYELDVCAELIKKEIEKRK